jgi:hypothetical protein
MISFIKAPPSQAWKNRNVIGTGTQIQFLQLQPKGRGVSALKGGFRHTEHHGQELGRVFKTFVE